MRDPGLQPERTMLAWRRTMLTASAVLLICARAWTDQPSPTRLATLAVLGASTAVLGVGLAQRRRRYRADPEDPRPPSVTLLLTVSIAPAAAALIFLVSLP